MRTRPGPTRPGPTGTLRIAATRTTSRSGGEPELTRFGEPGWSGLIVVDKPGGWTSHQVVGRVRRLLGTRKVGHAGTLDPMATGALVVGVNQATRLLGHVAAGPKSYLATVRLGADTVTDDADGEFTRIRGTAPLGTDPAPVIAAALPEFTGAIEQRPSAVSAIKVDGVRSYARVRAGQDVHLPARPVRVDTFDLRQVRPATLEGTPVIDCDVAVDCSSGTYIRALARDLGARLGTGGHLTALRRTRVEPFGAPDLITLDALAAALDLPAGERDQAGPDGAVIDLGRAARRCFAGVEVSVEQARVVAYGRGLEDVVVPADPTAVFAPDGRFLALYRPDGAGSRPVSVFVGPEPLGT